MSADATRFADPIRPVDGVVLVRTIPHRALQYGLRWADDWWAVISEAKNQAADFKELRCRHCSRSHRW